jgi:hypothetical protein
MRKNILLPILIIVLFLVQANVKAQNIIASYTNNTSGALDVVANGLTGTPLTRVGGTSPGSPCPTGFNTQGFNETAYSNNEAIEMVLRPVDTNTLNITALTFGVRRSNAGARNVRLAYKIGTSGPFVEPTTTYSPNGGSSIGCGNVTNHTISNLTINVPRGSSVTLRLCHWGGTNPGGTNQVLNWNIVGTVNGTGGTTPVDTTGTGGGGGGAFREQYQVLMPEYNQDSIGFDTARLRASARLLDTARIIDKGFIYKLGLVAELRFESTNIRTLIDSSSANLSNFVRIARPLTPGVEYSVVAFVRYRFNGRVYVTYSPVRSVITKENRVAYFFRGGLLPLASNITLQPTFQGVAGTDTLVVQNLGVDTLTVATLRTADGTISMLPNPLRINPFASGEILIAYQNESTGTYSNTFQFFTDYLSDENREITATYTVNSAPANYTFATLPTTNVTQFTAKLNALLQNNSTQQLLERGFVYNLASDNAEPSITDPQSTIVRMPIASAVNYDSTIDNIEAGTAYRYKAFIRTNFGTYYGTIESFTTVPLSVKANVITQFSVWPVPATHILNFGNEAAFGGTARIFNSTGKLVLKTTLLNGQTSIGLPTHLNTGQYLLLLNLNNGKVLKTNFLKK